jgi:hypothetical protein
MRLESEATSKNVNLKRSNTINPDIIGHSSSTSSLSRSVSISKNVASSNINDFNYRNRSSTITSTDDFKRIKRNRFKSFTLKEKDDDDSNSSEFLSSYKGLASQSKSLDNKMSKWTSLFKSVSSNSLITSANSITNEPKTQLFQIKAENALYENNVSQKPILIYEKEDTNMNSHNRACNLNKLNEISRLSRVIESKEVADIK